MTAKRSTLGPAIALAAALLVVAFGTVQAQAAVLGLRRLTARAGV